MSTPITLSVAGILLNWLVEEGAAVRSGDVIAEIEADKATVEIEAPVNGILLSQSAQPGDELAEGATIAAIAADGEDTEVASQQVQEVDETVKDAAVAETEDANTDAADPAAESIKPHAIQTERLRVSPLARKLAAERGIELSQVKGSGPNGRIVKEDVENFAPSRAAADHSRLPAEGYEELEIGRMRKRIGEGTSRSKREAPHFYVTIEVDVDSLLEMRKQWNQSQPEAHKASVNDLLVKAVALTLRDFPNLNTHFAEGKLLRHLRRNIGISVALEDGGLINVVASDADRRELAELARTNREMIERTREGRIRPGDVEGATFTISNLGPYDVLEFSAIIDPPQAGILAVSSARRMPIVREDGSVGVGMRMRLTISVDHRVSDGAEAARFMQQLRQHLESPLHLFLSEQE